MSQNRETDTPPPTTPVRAGAAPSGDRGRRRGAALLLAGAVLAIASLVGYGAWGHAQRRDAAVQSLQRQASLVPDVRTSLVQMEGGPRQVELPCSIEAFDSATVFARATGYIAKRLVDIGSKVKEGDVLTVIAAPDLDQQLSQARAQLAQLQAAVVQAQANANLAQVTNERTKALVAKGWQTQQQGDVDRLTYAAQLAALNAAQVNVKAQQAAVDRLVELTGFERVTAPFPGTITARHIDAGSLVTADVASGTPLFSIDRTDVLRVPFFVPQEDVFGLRDGEQARVLVPEIPGQTFTGRIARNASALDPGTRTLRAEVDLDNTRGLLRAGLYCSVQFSVPRENPIAIVPGQALIFDQNGLSVAVEQDGALHLRHVELARDDGAQVEVRNGLAAGDRIILNPPIDIRDGMRVHPVPVAPPASTQQASRS
jgi:RND family efflux transporter MFP subunit